MIVKENPEIGMITIYTGGEEYLTVFHQVGETEKDSIYALRLKSVRLIQYVLTVFQNIH